jgi:hypothetical protein
MKPKVVFSILLSVLAVVGPPAVLYFLYGIDSTVDAESGKDLVAIIGTILFSFSLGLGSAALLKSVDKSFLLKLVEDVLRGREIRRELPARREISATRRHTKAA